MRHRTTAPAWLRGARRFVVASALALLAGCATARNYDKPAGPVFVGRHQGTPPSTYGLRIVTFNVKFGERVGAAAALLRTSQVLRAADVVLLQELDAVGTDEVARALGLNYAYVPSAVHPSTRRDLGVAILSPWPLEDAGKVLLPHRHRFRGMRRSAARATVRIGGAGPVRVYAVHLETAFGASGQARRDQARAVLQDAADWPGPVVVAGDFNGTAGARELATSGFAWLTRRVGNTAGVFDLDHILVRGLCPAGEPPAARGPDTRGISDHRPVWALVRPCAAGG